MKNKKGDFYLLLILIILLSAIFFTLNKQLDNKIEDIKDWQIEQQFRYDHDIRQM